VDSALNSNDPCASGAEATGVASSQRTGVSHAVGNLFTFDTTGLDATKAYSLCYAEIDGAANDTWVDAAIRLTVPEIHSLTMPSGYVGVAPKVMTSSVTVTDMQVLENGANKLLQQANVVMSYVGILAGYKSLSIVDATYNSNDPCVDSSITTLAPAATGSTNSRRVSGVVNGSSTGKVFSIPQAAGNLLDQSKEFAVCYTAGDGTSGATWKDSYIRMKITKMESLEVMKVIHRSAGMLPRTASSHQMAFTYAGAALGDGLFLAIVDETMNNYQPCVPASAPLSSPDTQRTGAVQAASGTKIARGLHTLNFVATSLYAVCYAEGEGTTADSTWRDSGIRVRVPKVETIVPCASTFNTPAKHMGSQPLTSNRIPRISDQYYRHTGTLGTNKFFALVEHSINTYNPCVLSSATTTVPSAGGGTDTRLHSGVMQASGERFKVPQALGDLLDPALMFAVCFAEVDGTSTDVWYDTYVRLKTTEMEGVKLFMSPGGVEVLHNGHSTLPYHLATTGRKYQYQGNIPTNAWLSFVDDKQGTHVDTLTGCTVPDPCAEGNHNFFPIDQHHSGFIQAVLFSKDVTGFDTTTLNSDRTYSLCYATDSVTYKDTGVLWSLSKVQSLNYGYPATPIGEGSKFGAQYISREVNTALSYTGDLPAGKYINLVKMTLNSNHPCADPSNAALSASSQALGVQQASGKNLVVNTSALELTAGFAVCYAEVDGAVTDVTWADTQIRVTLSKVARINVVGGGELTTTGPLGNIAGYQFTYHGSTLGANKWFSMIDASMNSNIPCPTQGFAAGDAQHTGVAAATGYNFTLDTTLFTASVDYAICYAEVDGSATDTWYDSGIRVQIVKWNNAATRIASGAPYKIDMNIRAATLQTTDTLVLLHSEHHQTCETAYTAAVLSDGTKVRRNPTGNIFQMPSGSVVAGQSSITDHTVDDVDLSGGDYILCFCATGHGDGGCNDPKEFFTLNRPLRVLHKPRLGRDPYYHVDGRSVTGSSGVFGISSVFNGSHVKNGDTVFVAPDCFTIPGADGYQTSVPKALNNFGDVALRAQFGLSPAQPLMSLGGGSQRNLVTCFASIESLAAGPTELAYTTLDDTFHVIDRPRMGLLGNFTREPGQVQVLEKSEPDIWFDSMRKGDLIFFKESSCADITLVTTNDNDINGTNGTGFLPAHSMQADGQAGKVSTPPTLTYAAGPSPRYLTPCFVPAGQLNTVATNIFTLVDKLRVVPEPTERLTADWPKGYVKTLDFQYPRSTNIWSSSQIGDMFVLKPISADINGVKGTACHDAYLAKQTDYFGGVTHSTRVTLVASTETEDQNNLGAIARSTQIAIGKLNDLQKRDYYICYAPRDTGGDSPTDFGPLATLFKILDAAPGGPLLTVNSLVPLGADVFVKWNSHQGYTVRNSQPGAWIGIFKHNDCSEAHTTNPQDRHKCYLGWALVKEGEGSGQVIFPVADYKTQGVYEVRYFRGDSLDDRGRACKAVDTADGSTFTQCVFEQASVSAMISVPGDITHMEEIGATPGIMDATAYVDVIRDASMLEKFRKETTGAL